MKTYPFSRRRLLQGGAVLAGAAASTQLPGQSLMGTAFGQTGATKSALLVVFFNGGYNALFGSADSFQGAGTFGVTANNVLPLQNGLVVDRPTFGTLPQVAQTRLASVGVKHNQSGHGGAQQADWTFQNRNFALMLANAMGGDGTIKCAVAGGQMPPGPRTAEGGVTFQTVTDMQSTITALGGANNPAIPARDIGANGLIAAESMSMARMVESPASLRTLREGFPASIATLQKPVQVFNFNEMATAYNLGTATAVNSFTSKMAAAELMIRAGSNVVVATDGGWDTHGDRTGTNVRNMMNQRIMPGLNTFLTRMMGNPDFNVVTLIMGDFARSLPGSDHQPNLTANIIGNRIRQGTTGRTDANVGLPATAPNTPGMWALAAEALGVTSGLFGANPHATLLQP